MRRNQIFVVVLLSSSVLAGCGKTFNQAIGYDTRISNAPGTITVSDPKLYTREELINERAAEVAWIERLISQSEDPTKVVFKPDIVRELEQISAFSATLGLKFDPAAALNYQRARETGDIQQEIEVLKLQLQLEQLRRDADLLRAGLAAQTEPVNPNLGTLGEGSVAPASGGVTAPAAAQLKETIDSLLATLKTRLDTAGQPIAAVTASPDPFDDFRDRTAYREMLRSARNAAKLDELHDSGGARLIRLNFETTVLPDPAFARSLGAVQVQVVSPPQRAPSTAQLQSWLDYVNTAAQFRATNRAQVGGRLAGRGSDENFQVVDVGGIELLLPVFVDNGGNRQEPGNVLRRAQWDNLQHDRHIQDTLDLFSSVDQVGLNAVYREMCAVGTIPDSRVQAQADRAKLALETAYDREHAGSYRRIARKLAERYGLTVQGGDPAAQIDQAERFRRSMLERLGPVGECRELVRLYSGDPASLPWVSVASSEFGEGAVRVYEVGPREQVQQVSTVARSANSLAMAASIAASAPGSGAAADAALGYSRQAMGRASAIERVPAVVGYSVASQQQFGWVLGPRATLDPRGRIVMDQRLKPYDLAVDLSVPGWWPELELEVTTTWGPSPAMLAEGLVPDRPARKFKVELARNPEEAITQFLLDDRKREVRIDSVAGGPVTACSASTLLIRGDNLWRAERVLILGQLLDSSAIRIAPDMNAILVTVPAITPLANGNYSKDLVVMTPLGEASWPDFQYLPEPSGEACKPAKPQTAAAADAITIGAITPALDFVVPSEFDITVAGTNLKKIVAVKLHGQSGKIISAGDKSLTIKFDERATSSIPSSDNIALEFFEKVKDKDGKETEKLVETKRVRIRANQAG